MKLATCRKMCENQAAMKKVLSLLVLLGAMAGTASALPYYLPQPAGGALTPYDWQPVYSVEGIYSWTSTKQMPDTAGARLKFSLYNNATSTVRHQFSISGGYGIGAKNTRLFCDTEDYTLDIEKLRIELESIPVTLGYDVNLVITDNVMFDFGVKGGYAFGFLSGKVKDGFYNDEPLGGYKQDYNTGGFTYGLSAGIKVQFSESVYVRLAYEFNRTFFTKDVPRHLNFSQNGIVLSIGCLF